MREKEGGKREIGRAEGGKREKEREGEGMRQEREWSTLK